MNAARPLRTALLTNAVFSTACGLSMLVWPASVATLLGPHLPWLWRLLGFGLLLFAIDLVHQAARPRLATWRALYASISDFLWVVGSVAVLLLFSEQFSTTGIAIVAIAAAIVAIFGGWQIWGIDRAHRAENPALYRHCLVVRTEAPAAAMWEAIARMGDIQKYTPSLLESKIVGGQTPGVGAIRRCTDRAGRCWAEECVDFDAGRSLTVRFLAEAVDFPFPADRMVGGWQVTAVGTGSEVMVWWELAPKPRLLAPILLPILAFGADRTFVGVVRHMADDALGRKHTKARLVLRFC